MARTVTCDTCGKALGNPACPACRRAAPSPPPLSSDLPAAAVPGSGPVLRDRRDQAEQKALVGGARATDPRLTTRDVADRLGVSTNFVIGEIRDGRLDAMVVEREGLRALYRISESSLATYLQRHKWTSTGRADAPDAPHEPQP